ncbi:MAG: hypothetical protein HDT27_00735, partial [Subdoligranulum sp.]|nr:hypothetical protein [Subdoligranulum sp.]
MEESKRIFSIQTEGVKNYLTTELAAGEQLIPYCAKLLKNNEIPGLLPMRYQMLDGQVTVKYDISGKIRLGEYMTQRHVPYQAGSMILKNLCDTFRGLPQYFLSVQQCVLDSECVFIGDGLRTFFPCLPVEGEGGESGVSLQSFFAKLLGDYFATEDRTDFDEMFKWVHKSAFFDLEAFEQRFLQAPAQDREGPAETPPKPQPGEAFPVQAAPAGQTAASSNSASETKKKIWEPKNPLPVAGSQKQKEKNAQPAAAPSGAGVLNVPGGGSISIPNAAPQASPKKKKEDPEKEKKGFWIFGNHREKNKDPKEKEQAPASLPAGVPQAVSGAAAPATAPKPAP